MATGIQSTSTSRYLTVRLLDANAGTSAIPTETATVADALKAVPTAAQFFDLRTVGFPGAVLFAPWEIFVHNTAGTAAVNCKVRLWAYSITSGKVYPWGVGTGAAKGIINEGNSIDESDTDKVRHWERIEGPGMADGIMAQIHTSNGTGTEAWTVDVRCPMNQET